MGSYPLFQFVANCRFSKRHAISRSQLFSLSSQFYGAHTLLTIKISNMIRHERLLKKGTKKMEVFFKDGGMLKSILQNFVDKQAEQRRERVEINWMNAF